MTTAIDAAQTSEFAHGVAWGIAALAVCLAVGVIWTRRAKAPAPVAGVAIAAAALIALDQALVAPTRLVLGCGALLIAGVVADLLRRPLVSVPLAVPGAVAITTALPSLPRWTDALMVLTIAVGAPLAASFDARHGTRPVPVPALAIACFGVYATVPDTEAALVVLGVALPVSLAGWPRPWVRLGTAGALGAVAVMMWAAAVGGIGRPASIIGAAGTLGLLVIEPLGRAITWLSGRRPATSSLDRLAQTMPASLVALAAQGVLVFVAARVVGLGERPSVALLVESVTVVVGAAASAALAPVTPPEP